MGHNGCDESQASGPWAIGSAYRFRRATTVKRYRKTNRTKRLLAASRVGGVVTTRDPIVSPEVELMRKRILAEYERDVFSREVRLCPCNKHPKVRATEQLGVA